MLKHFIIFCATIPFLCAQPSEPGAKAAALGGSFVVQQSAYSSFYNTAGLAFLPKNSVAAGARNNYFINTLNDFYAVAAFAKNNKCVAFDAQYFGFDAYQDVRFGGSFALQLNNQWSLGTRLKYAFNYLPAESVSRHFVAADLGVLGILNQWRIGVSIINLAQSKWRGRIVERAPTTLKIGAGYFFSNQTALTADFHKSTNAPADVRVGLDFKPVEKIALRFGCSTSRPAVSFGLGIFWPHFTTNMGISWNQQLGISPQIDGEYAW